MRHLRRFISAVVVIGALGTAAEAEAGRWWCRGPVVTPACGVGNIGYSFTWSRWGWGGGWGFRPYGFCRPGWGGWCGPAVACGGPFWGGGGWCGATTWRTVDSVFLSVPAGGGATFFSGGVVPVPVWGCGYPTNWLPGWQAWPGGAVWTPYAVPLPAGVGPQFGPAGVMPFLGLSAAAPMGRPAAGQAVVRAGGGAPRPVIAAAPRAAGRQVAMRASSAAARLRAARLVAVGDRHLRAAGQDAAQLARAAEAYGRAAAIAQDQPDIHVRHAVALVALGREGPADEALARAVAVDGRLGSARPAPAVAAGDPVFGDRTAGQPAPLAARGAAILREIGGQTGADKAGVEAAAAGGLARLAAVWDRRWQAPGAAVAAIR
jgi:hypothetical protein